MVGDMAIAEELYDLSAKGWDVINVITEDYDLPLGAVGPCKIGPSFIASSR